MHNLPYDIIHHILTFISYKCYHCNLKKINLKIGICTSCKKQFCQKHLENYILDSNVNEVYCNKCENETWLDILNTLKSIFIL